MSTHAAGEAPHPLEREAIRRARVRTDADATCGGRDAPSLGLGAYIRPAKWRNAVRRRLFAAALPRGIELHPRADIEHVGTPYGGWPVPLELLDRSSTVYSVGAGDDVSFDLGLIERFGCEVHSFDPTEGAARHVASQPEPRLRFHNVAVWTRTGTLTMYRAANPAHIALSAANLQGTRETVAVPCRSIESVRAELGHERIDLIKLTVDGGEYELLPSLPLRRWGTRVLIVAFHHNRPARAALSLVEALGGDGFAPVARRETALTFAQVD
jgi:FkbM family methyltransferase